MVSKRLLKVFLCHSSGDRPAVRDLYHRLRSAADYISPWLDEEDLLPGQKWKEEIPKAVRRSDVVIVCLSQGSVNKRGYVQKEIKYALDVADEQPEGTIFLIPVGLEDCELPERLKHLHCVYIHEEKGFDRLIRALRSQAEKLGVTAESPAEHYSDHVHWWKRSPHRYWDYVKNLITTDRIRGGRKRGRMPNKGRPSTHTETSASPPAVDLDPTNDSTAQNAKKAESPLGGVAKTMAVKPAKMRAALHAVYRRAWSSRFFVLWVVIATACVAGYIYLKQSFPVRISSNLSEVKGIEFAYRNPQYEGISPLCGCYEEQKPDTWRGITFAARQVEIQRESFSPLTAYHISSAEPEKLMWVSGGTRFNAELYFLSIPGDVKFEPRLLLGNKWPTSYQVLSLKQFEARRHYMLLSKRPLNVELPGDKPLGAWIPSDYSKVSIGYSKGMFPAAKVDAVINETYTNKVSPMIPFDKVGMPLGDFLGPDVILWSEDADTGFLTGKEIEHFPPGAAHERRIVALVTHPPFSLRVAAVSEDEDALLVYSELMQNLRKSGQDYPPALKSGHI